MTQILSYVKRPPFGVMLYGIPSVFLLILAVVPYGHPQLNSVKHYLVIGNAISLFVISTILGVVVDNYFRSVPKTSYLKILIAGSFAWSFLISTSMLLVGYMAFKTYGSSHHTSFMPQDIYSNWSTLITHLLQGTLLGGIFVLPLNSLFTFLVRRRYRNRASDPSHVQ